MTFNHNPEGAHTMRYALVLAILNTTIHASRTSPSSKLIAAIIACAGALIVMALVRQTRAGQKRAQSLRRQPPTPLTQASLPHENGRPLLTNAYHLQSFTGASALAFYTSSSSDSPTRPALARERHLFASAFDAPEEAP